MTRTWTAVAWSACAAVLALLVLALSMVYLGWSTPLPEGWIPWRGQAITSLALAGAPVLGAFSARLREETEIGVLQGDLMGVVMETMQSEHASLWLRMRDERAQQR